MSRSIQRKMCAITRTRFYRRQNNRYGCRLATCRALAICLRAGSNFCEPGALRCDKASFIACTLRCNFVAFRHAFLSVHTTYKRFTTNRLTTVINTARLLRPLIAVPRSAPEEHDVYSLTLLRTVRSSGAPCEVGRSIYIPLLTERG